MYEYEQDGIERKYPYCDYELLPKSDWNYGFSDTTLIPYGCAKLRMTLLPFVKYHWISKYKNPTLFCNILNTEVHVGFLFYSLFLNFSSPVTAYKKE